MQRCRLPSQLSNIGDGSSNSIMLGERSGELSQVGFTGSDGVNFFDSSWIGFVEGFKSTGWPVLGWAGEPPKNRPTNEAHFHGFSQLNSEHSSSTMFAMGVGSIPRPHVSSNLGA